jgi:hypothetical protein
VGPSSARDIHTPCGGYAGWRRQTPMETPGATAVSCSGNLQVVSAQVLFSDRLCEV